MPEKSRDEEIRDLKNLRAELLAEYEKTEQNVDQSTANEEAEAILLRQSLIEDYEASERDQTSEKNNYVDEESDNDEDAPVEVLTRGRGL